eukprot:6471372-Pyramimonas_sp.AAC.1
MRLDNDAARIARRSQQRAIQRSLQEFREWAETAPAVGAVHKAIRDPVLPADTLEIGPRTLMHPKDIMDAKSEKWERLWGPADDELQQLQGLFVDMRQRILGESLMPLGVQELREALR